MWNALRRSKDTVDLSLAALQCCTPDLQWHTNHSIGDAADESGCENARTIRWACLQEHVRLWASWNQKDRQQFQTLSRWCTYCQGVNPWLKRDNTGLQNIYQSVCVIKTQCQCTFPSKKQEETLSNLWLKRQRRELWEWSSSRAGNKCSATSCFWVPWVWGLSPTLVEHTCSKLSERWVRQMCVSWHHSFRNTHLQGRHRWT